MGSAASQVAAQCEHAASQVAAQCERAASQVAAQWAVQPVR